MAKLRIGKLPDDRPVKRTITFTAALDALIRDYAAAIAAQDGPSEAPPVEKLVPIIVERFITSDRAFQAPMYQAPPAVPHISRRQIQHLRSPAGSAKEISQPSPGRSDRGWERAAMRFVLQNTLRSPTLASGRRGPP
jgi:hypothetical protein